MLRLLLVSWTALFGIVNAHFQLQFPAPRGPFVEDDEPTFCDGFRAVGNRTEFPLSGGFYSLNSEHPRWTVTALLAPIANPTSFDNFTQVTAFGQLTGEGVYCLPLDFSTSNITTLAAGQNVTLQIEFSGGDGNLFQCADLTLSDSVSLTSQTCANATAQAGSSNAPSSSSGAPSPSTTQNQNGAVTSLTSRMVYVFASIFALFVLLA
ncbi:hypothetical protein ONZ45_g9604 [Pleurotus djamor]|nr:hypothetical protein ONZ45_g9604 [Pleurotus djamor]